MRILTVAPVVLVVGISMAAALLGPDGRGGADAAEPAGHAKLVQSLAQLGRVEVLRSSVALLPTDAGTGDALFLFPTQRPPTAGEAERVAAFVVAGGHVIMAADGDNAMRWSAPLGASFRGVPAVVAPGYDVDCVPATLPGSKSTGICLPSPTLLADVSNARIEHVASYSEVPLFLDLDSDGVLGPGDQGPVHAPVALSWTHGAGRVTMIADSDVWRNAAMAEFPANEAAAAALVGDAGRVYFDATAWQPSAGAKVQAHWYRAMASSDPWHWSQAVIVTLLIMAGAATVQRATPLLPHKPENQGDPELGQLARAALARYLLETRSPES